MPKILIVDDEVNITGVLDRFLKKSGYDVLVAGDGETAIEIFQNQRDIDLVVLDSKMPKMRGVDVLRQLKDIDSKIPVLMFSGDINVAGRLEEFESLGCPPEDILTKPIALPLLDEAIRRKLKKSDAAL